MATFHIQSSDDALVAEFETWVRAQAADAIEARGTFSWALSGGSTPKRLFARMAQSGGGNAFPWAKTDLYWGDERDVLPTHLDSNFGAAEAILLRTLQSSPRSINRWMTEYRPPEALADYRNKLQRQVEGPWPRLDLVLLGLGPEGHTASLFPRSPALDSRDWVEHVYVPEHQSWRYTLTLPIINHARTVAFLVTGAPKAEVVKTILSTPPDAQWPATMVADEGRLHWFLDQSAASQISDNVGGQ